jgi:hypothetical protein
MRAAFGVTFLSNKLVAKRLELLSNLVPGTAPIGMLAARDNPNTDMDVNDALAAANDGWTLHVVKVSPEGGIDAAVAALLQTATFAPGRMKPATRPNSKGSTPITNTIGTLAVAAIFRTRRAYPLAAMRRRRICKNDVNP